MSLVCWPLSFNISNYFIHVTGVLNVPKWNKFSARLPWNKSRKTKKRELLIPPSRRLLSPYPAESTLAGIYSILLYQILLNHHCILAKKRLAKMRMHSHVADDKSDTFPPPKGQCSLPRVTPPTDTIYILCVLTDSRISHFDNFIARHS